MRFAATPLTPSPPVHNHDTTQVIFNEVCVVNFLKLPYTYRSVNFFFAICIAINLSGAFNDAQNRGGGICSKEQFRN